MLHCPQRLLCRCSALVGRGGRGRHTLSHKARRPFRSMLSSRRCSSAAQPPCPASSTQVLCPASSTQAPCPAGSNHGPCPAGSTQAPCPAGSALASCPARATLAACQAAASALASSGNPYMLEPAWSVPPAPHWPFAGVNVSLEPPVSVPTAPPWPLTGTPELPEPPWLKPSRPSLVPSNDSLGFLAGTDFSCLVFFVVSVLCSHVCTCAILFLSCFWCSSLGKPGGITFEGGWCQGYVTLV